MFKAREMNPINKSARLAGLIYLVYIVTHVVSDVWRDSFILPGEAGATADKIMAHEGLFTLTAVGDLVAAALFFLAAWALYALLRPVDKNLALLFLLLNLGGVALQCSSDLFLFAGQMLMKGPESLSVIRADQLQALAMFFLDVREKGLAAAQLFYGLWIFPLGYLVFRSGFLPKALGIVLMVHCVTWTSTFFQSFLFPGFSAITFISYPLGFLAEFGLAVWLLIMGVKERK